MKWRYKTLMLLILLIFCIGIVCAADTNTCYNGVDYSNGYAYGHIDELI